MFGRLSRRTRRVLAASASAAVLAVVTLSAQFAAFDPAFEGELWGVRQTLAVPNDGFPLGVTLANGSLYAVDGANAKIVAYDSNGTPVALGATDFESPDAGWAPSELAAAVVEVDGVDTPAILVSDEFQNRAMAFAVGGPLFGTHLFSMRLDRPGVSYPTGMLVNGMAMGPAAKFVLDTVAESLSLQGSFAAAWVEAGRNQPGAVLGYTNVLFVLNAGTDEFEGAPTAVLTGLEGGGLTPQYQEPYGIAFDPAGNLYTVDVITERIRVYDASFAPRFTFGTPAADGTVTDFRQPFGLLFWPDAGAGGGRLLVGDAINSRVVVYRPNFTTNTLDRQFAIEGLFKIPGEDYLGEAWSMTVDTATGMLSVSDPGLGYIWKLQTPNIAAFDVQVLDDTLQPAGSVCLGDNYSVRFSVTVPDGRASTQVTDPFLLLDGVDSGVTPSATVAAPYTVQAGQVVTYTYPLTLALGAPIEDIVVTAGVTASTADVLFSQAVVSVADCAANDAPTVSLIPSEPAQVSGWTPVYVGQTFSVTIDAQDDSGIKAIEYQLLGANQDTTVPVTYYDSPYATSQQVGPVELPEMGTTSVRFRTRDDNGRWSDWQTQAFRLVRVRDRLNVEDDEVDFTVGSSVGVGYVFAATGLPDGVDISETTGQISGKITFDAAAASPYTVIVTETLGSVTTEVTFQWEVLNANRHPYIEQPVVPASITEDVPFSIQIVGSDPDGDVAFFTVHGRSVPGDQELPDTISIDPVTGLISGYFPFNSARAYSVTVGLAECRSPEPSPPCGAGPYPTTPGLATLYNIDLVVTNSNRVPEITNPGTQSSTEGDTIAFTFDWSDPDTDDTITFAATNLPSGLSINPDTGAITGVIGYDALRSYAVTIQVADGIADPAPTETFDWLVADANRAPAITAVPDQVNDEGQTPTVQVSATDADGDTLTYRAVRGLPPGLSIDSNGLISGTLTYASAGVWEVVIAVSDGTVEREVAFIWTVNNVNSAPTVSAGNRVNAEGDELMTPIPVATANDPEGDDLEYSATGLPPGLSMNAAGLVYGTVDPSGEGNYTVVVTVDDGEFQASANFDWTITSVNRPPTLPVFLDRTSLEGSTTDATNASYAGLDLDGDGLTYTMTGLPDTHAIDGFGAINGTFTYESAGDYVVTVTVTDELGATASRTFTWTVVNVNREPTLITPNRESYEGQTVAVAIEGSDPDGDTLIDFSMNGLPDGFEINPATGVITGTFNYFSAGVYTVYVGVTDGAIDGSILRSFTWTVFERNGLPVITSPGPQSNTENDPVSLTVTATDPEGSAVTFTALGLPDGLSMSASGVISGTLSYASAGVHTVQVFASDGSGDPAPSVTFTWTVANLNRPPVVTATDQTDDEGDVVVARVVATGSDPDGQALTYSAAGLPPGLLMAPATGLVSGTLPYDAAGPYTVTVTVNDNGTTGATATDTFVWTVNNKNAPPVLVLPPPQTNLENESPTLQLVGTDVDDDTLTYSATGLPGDLSIDPSTGLISGTLSYDAARPAPYTVVVTVTDGPLSAQQTFLWTVGNVNRPPTVAAGPRTNAENDTIALASVATASDPDGDALIYSATGLPTGLTMDASGAVSGYLGFNTAGDYTVTVSVRDAETAIEDAPRATFVWTVTNTNRPPTPANDLATVVQGTSVTISVLGNDTDPDGTTPTLVSVEPPSTGSAVANPDGTVTYTAPATFVGLATFTYTVTDGDLTATATVSVTVQTSNQPPVCTATVTPSVIWPPNHKPVYLTLSGITDPEGGALTIRFTGILQDEPTNSVGQGNTLVDGGIENNGARAWVRAERSGTKQVPGDGRVYIVSYTATDPAGASCAGEVQVGVPHDQRGTPAVLSPGRWNSLTGQPVSGFLPPVAANDTAAVAKGKYTKIPVLANDTGYGLPLTVSIVSAPSFGQVSVNSDGTITYRATSSTTGTATFVYAVSNGVGGVATATVTVTVRSRSDDDHGDDDDDDRGDHDREDDCGDSKHDHKKDSDNRDRDHKKGKHDRCRHSHDKGDSGRDNDDKGKDKDYDKDYDKDKDKDYDKDKDRDDDRNKDKSKDCGDDKHDHSRDSDGRDRDHNRGNHDRCRHR